MNDLQIGRQAERPQRLPRQGRPPRGDPPVPDHLPRRWQFHRQGPDRWRPHRRRRWRGRRRPDRRPGRDLGHRALHPRHPPRPDPLTGKVFAEIDTPPWRSTTAPLRRPLHAWCDGEAAAPAAAGCQSSSEGRAERAERRSSSHEAAEEFPGDTVGQLVPTIAGGQHCHAAVPCPLPHRVQYSSRIAYALSEASGALGELSGLCASSSPALLISPFMRREAVLSSRIEGTQTMAVSLRLPRRGSSGCPAWTARPRRTSRRLPTIRGSQHGLDALDRLPLSLRLIREVHSRLLDGARGRDRAPVSSARSELDRRRASAQDAVFVLAASDEGRHWSSSRFIWTPRTLGITPGRGDGPRTVRGAPPFLGRQRQSGAAPPGADAGAVEPYRTSPLS